MNQVKKIIFVFIINLTSQIVVAQNNQIKIFLDGPLNNQSELVGYCFSIKVCYNLNNNVKVSIPHCINWAYSLLELDSSEHKGFWLVQKKINNEYLTADLRTKSNDHGGRCFDEMGNELLDTLAWNKPIMLKKCIGGYYYFRQGSYRVKIVLNNMATQNLDERFINSNWVYFDVK
jgi:hypothetical protein